MYAGVCHQGRTPHSGRLPMPAGAVSQSCTSQPAGLLAHLAVHQVDVSLVCDHDESVVPAGSGRLHVGGFPAGGHRTEVDCRALSTLSPRPCCGRWQPRPAWC